MVTTVPQSERDMAKVVFSLKEVGAVAQNFQETLLVINQFGATGDGTTDDTAAVTKAITAAAALKQPLLLMGGGTYIVDSLAVPSNLNLIGDGNTTLKLKTNATGAMFAWSLSATTDNVTIRDLILDGNYSGQSGAPHNLIHGIFYGDSTVTVTNSEFSGLSILNIDGSAFAYQVQFTDCVFDNIRISNHSQTAFDIYATRCRVSRCYVTNTGAVRAGCFSYSFGNAVDCTFRDLKAVMSTDTAFTKAGFALTGASTANNVVDGIDIDSSSVTNNFAFTIDTGDRNTITNCIARNGIYNCDYEIFNQTNFLGSNLHSKNVAASSSSVGMIIDGGAKIKIEGYNYDSTTKVNDAVTIRGTTYSAPTDIELSNFVIDGAFDGFRFEKGTRISLTNGIIKNCDTTSGYAFYQSGTTQINELTISNLFVDTAQAPFLLNKVDSFILSNSDFKNITTQTITLDPACTNTRISNCRGLIATRWGTALKYGFKGHYDGKLYGYYSFPVHGGAIGTIDFGETLPGNSVVERVTTVNGTLFTSATTTAKLSLGYTGSVAAFVAAATIGTSNWVLNNFAYGIQDGLVANNNLFISTTDANVVAAISVEAITAGFAGFCIEYSPGYD